MSETNFRNDFISHLAIKKIFFNKLV